MRVHISEVIFRLIKEERRRRCSRASKVEMCTPTSPLPFPSTQIGESVGNGKHFRVLRYCACIFPLFSIEDASSTNFVSFILLNFSLKIQHLVGDYFMVVCCICVQSAMRRIILSTSA